jgi:D-alanyl-D-alanine-carboxypeptidase/D-alanyl-D-alanine-endopeptidase
MILRSFFILKSKGRDERRILRTGDFYDTTRGWTGGCRLVHYGLVASRVEIIMKSNLLKRMLMLTLLMGGLAVLLIGWTARLWAQEKPKSEADIIALLDKCVAQQKRAPGIVVGIISDKGAKVFAKGACENGHAAPVDGDTVFEIGSVTKVFTALLLQEMVDSGEVTLDDPINKYLPPTVKTPSRNGREITLVDLATQTSGLPRMPDNFNPKDPNNPYADYTVGQLYDFLSRYQLKRDIGGQYEYSNLGAGLLGHVLALRAGTNYEALVTRRICDPLRMNSTRITLTPELKSRLAPGHDAGGSTVENWDLGTLAGAGGLRSTVNDMLKFLAANIGLTSTSLSNAMLAAQQPHHAIGSGRQIGLIWQIQKDSGTVWHNGGTGGYHSYIGFTKDRRRAVVVLANSANDIDDLGQCVLGDRSDVKDFNPPKIHQAIQVDTRIYDDYVGQYNFQIPGVTITVTREGDHLFARLTGQERYEIFPESETDFFYKVVDAQLTFEKDAAGTVTDVILHQNGRDQKVTKVKK